MIRAHDLHKSFKTKTGTVNAVSGVSFEAHDGQITGLLGPNGAGKTTTMRMLYTLMTPDRGEVRVDGLDTAREPAADDPAVSVPRKMDPGPLFPWDAVLRTTPLERLLP